MIGQAGQWKVSLQSFYDICTLANFEIDMLCSSTTETEELLKKAEYSQPLCIAIQVALTNFLAKCGVEPDAIVGHSGGETAGAYAAKALTAAEAILVAYYRGLVTKLQTRRGAMAAVGLGSEATAPYLADGVVVACENSPKGVTISGDEEAVEKTLKAIEASDSETFTRRLQVEMAYHSCKNIPSISPWNPFDDLLMFCQTTCAKSVASTRTSFAHILRPLTVRCLSTQV